MQPRLGFDISGVRVRHSHREPLPLHPRKKSIKTSNFEVLQIANDQNKRVLAHQQAIDCSATDAH